MEFNHVSVLLNECLEALNIKEDGIYVDCTLGGAGHSSQIVKRLSNEGRLIGIDQDKDGRRSSQENCPASDNTDESPAYPGDPPLFPLKYSVPRSGGI